MLAAIFVLRAPRPAPGQLWIDVAGQGEDSGVLLRTHSHLVVWGTGEVYGSAGRRFARQLLPLLRSAGYPRIDLWLPGALTRDTQAALRLGAAQLPVNAAMLPPASAPPPEMHACTDSSWQWDGIDFELRSRRDGRYCVLAVSSSGHSVVFGGAGGAGLATSTEGATRYVLDAAGLTLRSGILRL